MIVTSERPFCSLCLKPVPVAVVFLARSMLPGGHPSANRGGARKVRLCHPCIKGLLREFRR